MFHVSSFFGGQTVFDFCFGVPYYETEECILFCGDTLAMQKEIQGSLFDTIITSPPYNIGKEYEG